MVLIQYSMKSCYKSLKQLDSQREQYSSLDPIILSEYFLLILKVSSQIWEKFIVRYCKGQSLVPFIFYLFERNDSSQSNQLYFFMQIIYVSCINTRKQMTLMKTETSDWFLDNKLSMHFGEEMIKSILFASNKRAKKVC